MLETGGPLPMSDAWKIVLTSALTIVGGVIVLVFGHLAQRFFIDPLHEQTRVIGEIAYALAYYAPVYANPGPTHIVLGPGPIDLTAATEDALRALASRLIATTTLIRWPGLARFLSLPSAKDVLASASRLIGLSNSVRTGTPAGNLEIRNTVLRLLRITWVPLEMV